MSSPLQQPQSTLAHWNQRDALIAEYGFIPEKQMRVAEQQMRMITELTYKRPADGDYPALSLHLKQYSNRVLCAIDSHPYDPVYHRDTGSAIPDECEQIKNFVQTVLEETKSLKSQRNV